VEWRVIYNTSGTYLTAAVLEDEPISFVFAGQRIPVQGFLADVKTFHCEPRSGEESRFLAAMLNSPFLDQLIKPMQSRGLWGPRDIHKKVLELPIPQFDPADHSHQRLAQLAEGCASKVHDWLAGGGPGKIKSIGKLRSMVREVLAQELAEIDVLVKELLA